MAGTRGAVFGAAGWARVRALLPARADLAAMRRQPRRDVLAGLTVAVVALPLALGFGVSSGLGAAAGLATAIVAGILAALFGGSHLQVSGPTGAMTVVLVPIVHQFGPGGVLTVGVLAGLALIGLALARAGRFARYVPAPVVEGFTVGIAAVIFLQQVPAALGVRASHQETVAVGAWHALRAFLDRPHWPTLGIAAFVVVVMLVGGRWRPGVPFSLLAVGAATLYVQVAGTDVARIGALPSTLPAPSLAFFDPSAVPALLTAAGAVAALAALESLLSATVADGMTVGSRHDPDRELFGQGVANLVTPLFGGLPNSGVIARTALNVRFGARSRLAAVTHAAALALIMLAAAPLVAHIPLAALAGVLLATAIRMVELGSLAVLARSTRADALIMALTAVATLALDLVSAVGIGLVVACLLAISAIARAVRVEQVPLDLSDPDRELLAEHIATYRLDGPLFFAAAHRCLTELSEVPDVRVLILQLSRVTTVDGTGARVLRDAVERLERVGIAVYVSGIDAAHSRALESTGVLARLRVAGRVFDTTPEAVAAARGYLHRTGMLDLDAA
ncbi:SulP family inorganic anion transporter [Longispora sp. NPDC051575]|uniref:SulP family inorganic anion transporter n=1 Tax=Longispora sp. NPDC051575 TaxID=3154943 RepID=UPI00341BE479